MIPGDEHRQVLGHLADLDGLDAHLLEGVREPDDVGGVVELAAVHESLVQAKIDATADRGARLPIDRP